jgi:hypothetical protein
MRRAIAAPRTRLRSGLARFPDIVSATGDLPIPVALSSYSLPENGFRRQLAIYYQQPRPWWPDCFGKGRILRGRSIEDVGSCLDVAWFASAPHTSAGLFFYC